ncbi:MAG: MFS transporter [Chloroflexota bacterium]
MTAIRLVFLALGVALGSYLPYVAVIQSGKGFDPIAIGLIGAAGAALSVVAAPVWGHLGDVSLGRRRVIQIASLGATVAFLVFGVAALPLVLAGAWVTMSVFTSTTNPMADAVAVVVVRQTPGASFARLRMLLSLGFGLTAITTGLLYDGTGYGPAPFVAAGAFVLLAVTARLVPDPPRDAAAHAAAGRRGGSTTAAFAAAPRLPMVLLAIGLGVVGIIASFTYLPLRIEELGGSPSDVALASGLESLAEVPAFVLFGALAPRIGNRGLFALSGVLLAACLLALALLTSPALMIGVRLITGVGYAGLTVASVSALGMLLPAALQSTGQSLNAMTWSVASILLGLVGGTLYQLAGAETLFALTALLTLVAAALGFAVLPPRVAVPSAERA